jgi:hypothetical protein
MNSNPAGLSVPLTTPNPLQFPTSFKSWRPVAGPEWKSFIAHAARTKDLDADGQLDLHSNCVSILGACTDPVNPSAPRTGLVVGCIQSGKTLSFTGVAALARDSGFRIVIVISGTQNALLEQTRDRLGHDLGLNGARTGGFSHVAVDPESNLSHEDLARQFKAWVHPTTPYHLKRTVLVTVLKQAGNLRKVAKWLRAACNLLPASVGPVPALVIDDEADQASLNTRARRGTGESATYQAIRDVRAALPCHTFLQYTATAQAPLLLSIADTLSPDFCHVLEPGKGYTGGKAFLLGGPTLVRSIPTADMPSPGVPPITASPSMLHAMRVYLLGLAQELYEPGIVRSMLIHPSREIANHSIVEYAVREVLKSWESILFTLPSDDPDRIELIEDFKTAWDDLETTVQQLLPFEELLERLQHALMSIKVDVLNSQRTKIVDEFPWASHAGWILIGGQVLDRGFTVKGLTVTYMARDLPVRGPANADTLQQRARFFGYRQSYLSFCRVWLTAGVHDALRQYVEHEELLRDSLRTFAATGRPMREWRRSFLLDPSMAPTRKNVLAVDYRQLATLADRASSLDEPHLDGPELTANRELVELLRRRAGWTEWFPEGGPQSLAQRHVKLEIPLRELIDEVLMKWHACYPSDSEALTHRVIQADALLARDPTAIGTIVLMSPRTGPRKRDRIGDQAVPLMQGRDAGTGYPGDRAIVAPKGMTVQIHVLDIEVLASDAGDDDGPTAVHPNVPTLAIHCPERVDLVVQDQGGAPPRP